MIPKDPYNEIAQALGLKDLAPQIYKDLLQPSVQELGENLVTVAKCVAISLAPLEASVWGYAKIKEWLSAKITEKLAHKNPDEIQTPSLLVAGPALFNLTFAAHEVDLREMYANLLATAMDKKHHEKAHPSFVNILQQLSPDEAKIIRELSKYKPGQLVCEAKMDSATGAVIDGEKGVYSQFEDLCKKIHLENQNMAYAYLDNLIRLRILNEYSWTDAKYIPEGSNERSFWTPYIEHGNCETIFITEFGQTFIEACVE